MLYDILVQAHLLYQRLVESRFCITIIIPLLLYSHSDVQKPGRQSSHIEAAGISIGSSCLFGMIFQDKLVYWVGSQFMEGFMLHLLFCYFCIFIPLYSYSAVISYRICLYY